MIPMLRIDKSTGSLIRLTDSSTHGAGLLERYDIQKMIRQSANAFFKEMGEDLILIGEEIQPADFVKDRIDLLALDPEGATVVIELKRGTDNKLQLMQAVAYAGMLSEWEPERVLRQYSTFAAKAIDDARDDLEQFLGEALGTLNQSQRIILLADQFPYEVLVGSKWLREKDVRCYRFVLAEDDTHQVFLTCPRVYPPLELTETVTKSRVAGVTTWHGDWGTLLDESVDNPTVKSFFEKEIAAGVENTLAGGWIYYRIANRREFSTSPRRKHAYVWQYDRFDGDLEFWKSRLSDPAHVSINNQGKSLSFRLITEEDFKAFKASLAQDLPEKEFLSPAQEPSEPPPADK